MISTLGFCFRGDTALHQASLYGYKDIVDDLIAKGALIDTRNKDGKTPLISAASFAQQEHVTIVKRLIDKGANVNARDNMTGKFQSKSARTLYIYINMSTA